MRSAIRWTANRLLDLVFGRAEEKPEYPHTVPCPCDCGMTMGEVKELDL